MLRVESVESAGEVVVPRLAARSWRKVIRLGLLPVVLPALPDVPFVSPDVLLVLPDVLFVPLDELPPEVP